MKSYLLQGRANSYGATKRRNQYFGCSPMTKSTEKRNHYINQFQISPSLQEQNRMLGKKLSEMISENRRLRQKSYNMKTQPDNCTQRFSTGLKHRNMMVEINCQNEQGRNKKQIISEEWLKDQTRKIEESLNQRQQKYIKNRQKRTNDVLISKGYSYLNQNRSIQMIGTKKNSIYSGLYENTHRNRQKQYNKQNETCIKKETSPIQQKPRPKLTKQCYFNSISEKSNSINLSIKEEPSPSQEKQLRESAKIIKKKKKNQSLKSARAADFKCEVYLQQETVLCEPSVDQAKVFEEESFGGTQKQLSPAATPTNKEQEKKQQVNQVNLVKKVNSQSKIVQSIKQSNASVSNTSVKSKKEKGEKKHNYFVSTQYDKPKITPTPSKFEFKKSNQPYIDTSDYKLHEPKTQLKWSPFHSIKQNFKSSSTYQKENQNIFFAKSGNYYQHNRNQIHPRPVGRRTYISVISKSLQKCR